MDDKFLDSLDPESEGDPASEDVVTLEQFLLEDGWHPQRLEDGTAFLAHFVGENGEYRCYFQVRTELHQFFCYVLAPVRIPEERRVAAAEYLTRANYGLHIGNFEMDFEDGEVRYKTSLDFEDETLTENWIRYCIYPAVYTMDRYMPGLMKVHTGTGPVEAIEEVED